MAFDIGTSKPLQTGGFDVSSSQPVNQPEDFTGAGVIEPIRAVASGLARTVAGGIAGAAQAINPFAEEGAGAQTVEDIQSGAFQPQTEAGKEGLKTLGDLVQRGVDIANFPISGLAGLVELVSGQGIDQAVDTIKSTQEKGISTTAGQRVFEETGSPLAATIAETTPTAIGELVGLKGAGLAAPAVKATARAGERAVEGVKATAEALKPAAELTQKSFKRAADEAFNFQTPFKKRIAEKIRDGSTDIDVAKFKLSDTGKAVKDVIANNTITQGFDEGVIAAVKGASKADKDLMLKMVDTMEKGKKNKLFAAKNRPSDIAGDTLMNRFRSIRDANRAAGVELNEIAKNLKGKNVDINDAALGFADSLDELGVSLIRGEDGKFKPNFSQSQLAPGDRGPISEVIRQMNIRSDGGIDAFDVHKMKKVIDNNVTFGKSNKGISGDAERTLKSFRKELDGALDSTFPEYDRVNTVFAETIGAIDAFQDVAGRKMNLTGANADKSTGTLLRRLMGNAQSRVRLLDSIDEIESVAAKHGGSNLPRIEGVSSGSNDLLTQVLFVDELDSVFGPVARTSFQGQIDQAIKQGLGAATTKAGAVEAGISAVGKAAERVRGINEEGAFKAIKELLKQGNK